MRAPAFVYVVPAPFEDILKIGFSRVDAGGTTDFLIRQHKSTTVRLPG